MTILNTFKQFLEDDTVTDMFITGQAGTGKTTGLKELTDYCYDNNIPSVACAYTHKARKILASKLGSTADTRTLWSFLGKRPTVNSEAANLKHLHTSIVSGISERVKVLFIDEYSMIGERDLMDIREAQEGDELKEEKDIKIVWLGDLNQLPPVGDTQTLEPHGKYNVTLTEIYRQSKDNPLMDILNTLVNYIEGKEKPASLKSNPSFIRENPNLTELYKQDKSSSKIALAYTNEQVQDFNFTVANKDRPDPGDVLFSLTLHTELTYIRTLNPYEVQYVNQRFDGILELGSKYKALEFLVQQDKYDFMLFEDEEGIEYIFPVIFGTYNYRTLISELGVEAVNANIAIEREMKVENAGSWAKSNSSHPLAVKRSKAWRAFLTANNYVQGVDFNHCMTVHKAQGSTYKNVYLDIKNLYTCAKNDYKLYLKLLYVAISRASNKVWTN